MIRHRVLQWLGWAPRLFGPTKCAQDLAPVAREILRDQSPPGWNLLSSSAHTRVARGCWNAQSVFLKAFLPRHAFEPVKAIGRGSRGARAVDRSIQMKQAGFQTPRVAGWGCSGWRGEFVVTYALPYPSTEELFIGSRDRGQALRDHRDLLKAFGKEIGRLHQAGWIHGDLRLGNVLCDRNALAETSIFWFLDNEGNRKSTSRIERLKNLIQLSMTRRDQQSRTDQLRILQGYTNQLGLQYTEYRKLAKRIEQGRTRRWKRREAKGGPKDRFMPLDDGEGNA
ncbi:lipopolysaccharide kinase InaA family protein [Thioalkalivibrio sp. ALMg9]|uniref:lipopolysaccharide kinase InaA family protein n=1 Tax=Thioalkalivibrio sp. ALMg9 TaxID=1266912 RepID=UPI0004761796|nr:lipopolysaccharide kinase InaA family protein [Thioalkalivibrio sp. ALMg9]